MEFWQIVQIAVLLVAAVLAGAGIHAFFESRAWLAGKRWLRAIFTRR